jgi:hypothetical protein
MTTKRVMTQVAWLWLPLLLVALFAVGFYNSYLDPDAPASSSSCSQSTHLDRFLGCP